MLAPPDAHRNQANAYKQQDARLGDGHLGRLKTHIVQIDLIRASLPVSVDVQETKFERTC